ncbi:MULTISPECIES: vWA-MoxR associated conflict system protein [Streptomyces]|uniref:vWA-MoxR associated conflict system protein n=1 Tax=Streptomyces TaxID=1883 RepID=UPI0033D00418
MRRTTPARQLLVIAPQCPAMGLLTGLEDTAEALHRALLDPQLGGCEQDPSGAPSLLCGVDVQRDDVEKAVRAAAERAGEAEAVLILAFLGHGTNLGQVPKLSFMASDSREDVSTSVVDVGHLLGQSLDVHGVQGVVAVVDACHAGGASPNLDLLAGGVRQGATRLSLLMSAGATESSYGLAYTRALARILGEGLPGAGEFLSPVDVSEAVDNETGTDSRLVIVDGLSHQPRPWLARNAQHTIRAGGLLRALGDEDLRRALEPFGEAVVDIPIATVGDLGRLRRTLESLEPAPATPDQHTVNALRVLDRLMDAARTSEFLSSSWPGRPLQSDRIRRAYAIAARRPAPDSDADELLRECVESLCLRVPLVKGSPTAPLTDFVAVLAMGDGLACDTPRLAAWARSRGATVELADAFAAQEQRAAEHRLRLVISLHAAVADEWPETLLAWLLDGDTPVDRKDFVCTPTQSGVELQLGAVLKWATVNARNTGFRLRCIDIAAPAALLASWRPEETRLGPRLGLHYDLVLRWSDRLSLPAHLGLINEFARQQLDAMKSGGAPVSWLGRTETDELYELMGRIGDGWYERALALSHRPERLAELLELLLASAPIIFWPDGPEDLPAASRDSLERCWEQLPGEFSAAYRAAWRRAAGQPDPVDGHTDLARLRSVWLDEQWLDFCDWFETRSFDGEKAS